MADKKVKLRVIEGGLSTKKKEKKAKRDKLKEIYSRIYLNTPDPKKFVFFYIKYISKFTHDIIKELDQIKDVDEYMSQVYKIWQNIEFADMCISGFSLATFMNLFPIDKFYSNPKFQMKDYYSTVEFIEDNWDSEESLYTEMIGEREPWLLNEYGNNDIINFQVFKMMLLYRTDIAMGKKPVLDQWLEDNNVRKLTKIDDGVFLDNSTGEILREQKPKTKTPPYIRVIKGGQEEY